MISRERVHSVIDRIRPLIQSDGGDIELLDVVDNSATVRLTGNCVGCPSAQMTLFMGVEMALKEEIPEFEALHVVYAVPVAAPPCRVQRPFGVRTGPGWKNFSGTMTPSFLKTVPFFITNCTWRSASMSASGSPATAIRSATNPGLIGPRSLMLSAAL